MNVAHVLRSLERERELLEEFRRLSEEQLRLLADENIDGVQGLLGRRADLMVELTAIESTLGTWISQIRNDPSVTPEMMRELRTVNDEIVQLAREVMTIDAETHWRLDLIRERAKTELQELDLGQRILSQYGAAFPTAPRGHLDVDG